MGWSEKYKKSIDCNNPKGFSQKAHCQGKKKNETTMKLSELKEVIREVSRKKFHESLNESVNLNQMGKVEFTSKKLTPVDIQSVAFAYKNAGERGLTKFTKKTDNQIRIANDLSRLTGTTQLDAKKKSGKPALLVHLLKNKLVTKDEYISLYKDLVVLHARLLKSYLKGSSSQLVAFDKAVGKIAKKDMDN
jgi:hypothetical protein